MTERVVLLDLGMGDVHTPSAAATPHPMQSALDAVWDRHMAEFSISAEKRDSLPKGDFALPAKRKYPLDTAARTRNAAARLSQMKKRGKVTDAEYSEARARIAAAAKKHGIDSEFNASDDAGAKPKRVMPKPRGKAIHIRADLAPGGALHVRHMSDIDSQRVVTLSDGSFALRDIRAIKAGDEVDPVAAGITLRGPATWKDGTPKKLVWVQLAEVGAWRGHAAGAFEMTSATFSECVRNFERRGLPVPYDFEHASEHDPTSGSIPERGAPAPGWVHKLDNRGPAGLWGLTEWFDYARDGIKEGSFAFLSPAIRFGTKDAVTGAPAGAKLTSVAITNQPFLTHLDGLRTASDKVPAAGGVKTGASAAAFVLAGRPGLDHLVHPPAHYMPAVKAALKLPGTAMAAECSEHLDRLRELCMMAGPDGDHQGTALSEYTQPLRDIVGAQPGMTWDEVFDTVDDMIDAAIEDHEAKYHAGETPRSMDEADGDGPVGMNDKARGTAGAPTAGAATPATLPNGEAMTTQTTATTPTTDTEKLADTTVKLNEASSALVTANTALSTANASLDRVTLELRDVETRFNASDAVVKAVSGLVTLKADETLAMAIGRILEENKTLLADKAKREEADLDADVDVAFLTYKDAKGLAEANKPMMKRLCKADREAFNDLYPPVSPEKRHLLRAVTPPEVREGGEETLSVTALTRKIMAEEGLGYSRAQDEAARRLSSRNR